MHSKESDEKCQRPRNYARNIGPSRFVHKCEIRCRLWDLWPGGKAGLRPQVFQLWAGDQPLLDARLSRAATWTIFGCRVVADGDAGDVLRILLTSVSAHRLRSLNGKARRADKRPV